HTPLLNIFQIARRPQRRRLQQFLHLNDVIHLAQVSPIEYSFAIRLQENFQMKTSIAALATLACFLPVLNAQSTAKPFNMYFIDHGEDKDTREQVQGFYAWYTAMTQKAGAGAHMIGKPGDKIPIKGLNVEVVTSAGQVLKTPMKGAPGAGKPNPECANYKKQA